MIVPHNRRIIFTLILFLALGAESLAVQQRSTPPVVQASTSRVSDAYDVTLVYANLDLNSTSDDYGIYEKLMNLQDAEVIVRREYYRRFLNSAPDDLEVSDVRDRIQQLEY